jgi:hypothetical protein
LAGGNEVELSGSGFTGVAAVQFGSTPATIFSYDVQSHLMVVAPRHVAGRVNIRVVTSHGTSAVVANEARYTYTAAPRPLRVGDPKTIDPHATLDVISCPSSAFCAAFDTAGSAVMFQAGRWHSPVRVSGQAGGIGSVSCTSPAFCMAVDGGGHAFRWNGTTWQKVATFDSIDQWAVSCVTPSFCEAVDASTNAIRYNGTTWLDEIHGLDAQDYLHLTSIDCPSKSFCYAAGNEEHEYAAVIAYRDGRWATAAQPLSSGGPLGAISCPQIHFCAAGTDNGVQVWTGDPDASGHYPYGWSDEIAFRDAGTTNGPTDAVACSNATFCLAYWQDNVRGIKHWVRSDGASYAAQKFTVIHKGSFPTAVSCWARYACQFVGGTDTYRSA